MENKIDIAVKEVDVRNMFLVDIRSEDAFLHGAIPGARQICQDKIEENPEILPREKKIVLYCAKGILSRETAEN